MILDDGWTKIIAEWAWAGLLTLTGVVWKQQQTAMNDQRKQLESRIEALEATQVERNTAVLEHIKRHEGTLVHLSDRLETHAKDSVARHIELLNALHNLKH